MSLPLNLSAGFTMIVPNICDDMHSCAVSVGDAWLRRIVPLITRESQYQTRSLVLFITFDENDSMASNQVPTLVISPSLTWRARRHSLLPLLTLEHDRNAAARGTPRPGKTARSMAAPFHL